MENDVNMLGNKLIDFGVMKPWQARSLARTYTDLKRAGAVRTQDDVARSLRGSTLVPDIDTSMTMAKVIVEHFEWT